MCFILLYTAGQSSARDGLTSTDITKPGGFNDAAWYSSLAETGIAYDRAVNLALIKVFIVKYELTC